LGRNLGWIESLHDIFLIQETSVLEKGRVDKAKGIRYFYCLGCQETRYEGAHAGDPNLISPRTFFLLSQVGLPALPWAP
jgi:hypothetical protein